jgi:hypothetical protein
MIFKNTTIHVLTILTFSTNIFGWGNEAPRYKNAAIDQMHKAINQKAINVSTADVCSQKDTPNDVAQAFKEEFLTEAQVHEHVSEKRKTQRIMDLLRNVYNQKEVSGLTLEVNELFEDVSLGFQNKQEMLDAEIQGLFGKKVLCASVLVVGAAAFALGAADKRKGIPAQAAIIGGGITAVTAAGVFLSTLGKENTLRTHIAEVQAMQNAWETSFKK